MIKDKEMMAIYRNEIAFIQENNGNVDEMTAYRMLVHEFYAKKHLFGRKPKYTVPKMNWLSFEKDFIR